MSHVFQPGDRVRIVARDETLAYGADSCNGLEGTVLNLRDRLGLELCDYDVRVDDRGIDRLVFISYDLQPLYLTNKDAKSLLKK